MRESSGITASRSPAASPRRATGFALLAVLVLAGVTWWAHGDSLGDGPVLDDHWHQKALRELGWSYRDTMRSLVIEPAEFIHMWWQDRVARFEYPRPLFILAMKLLYRVIGGNDPRVLHAAAILLHLLSALLVTRLAWLLTGDCAASLAGGLVFALYPHAAVTVAWSSSLNVVLATTLMLGALLLFLRAGGLKPGAVAAVGPPTPPINTPAPPVRAWPLAGGFTLWLAALLIRENALMVPVILLALEWTFGGRQRVWTRRGVYAAFVLLGAAFLTWRALALSAGMPETYLRRPDGDLTAYALWCLAKFLHYVCASVWLAPMVVGPTGRYDPWTEVPGDCWLMVGIVAAGFAACALATRDVRGWWIWPLWIVLAILPVVPVIATPHSGYLPGVGMAVGCALAAAGRRGRPAGWPRQVVRVALGLYLAGSCALTVFNRWQWVSVIWGERYGVERVAASPPPQGVTDVFFLNLPLVNIYIKPALDERLGAAFAPVRCHALTFAPDPFMVEQPVVVERLDGYSFSARIHGQAWFSRLLGRLLLDGLRTGGALRAGEQISTAEFDVRVEEADSEGVWKLTFRFRRLLSDPRYCFYVFTPNCYATRLRFRPPGPPDEPPPLATEYGYPERLRAAERLRAGDAAAAWVLIAAARNAPGPAADFAAAEFRQVAAYVATATAAPEQEILAAGRIDPDGWERLARWWSGSVDDTVLAETWLWRARCAEFDELREEVPHARQRVAKVIRSDLYLTGPPFPGPRVRALAAP